MNSITLSYTHHQHHLSDLHGKGIQFFWPSFAKFVPPTQKSVSYDSLLAIFWQACHLYKPDVVTKSVLSVPTDAEQTEVFNCVHVPRVLGSASTIGHCVR